MITMQNVRKKYKDFELELSLEIPEGRITGFVGKNGAGKSTAIKLILGLVKPDAGKICVFGNEGGELPAAVKQKIGVSLTEAGFSSQFTVEDVWHILAKMYPDFQKDFFDQKCEALKLPRKKKLKEFSTGMKAKLRVLTAISHKADLLILDEPTAGLDPKQRINVRNFISEMSLDRCIIIATHIVSDVENIATRVIMLKKGIIQVNDAPKEIISELDGRVWNVPQNDGVTDGIISVRNDGGNVVLRVLSDVKPSPNAEKAPSTLEDAYFTVFSKE